MQNTPKSISRRTVASGLAWSVPAVATVAAAPFAAASPIVCVTVETGDAIKFAGGGRDNGLKQAYGFEITVTNTSGETVRVGAADSYVVFDKKGRVDTDSSLWSDSPCSGGVQLSREDDDVVLAPGDTETFFYVVNNTGNSANEAGCIYSQLSLALAGSSVGSNVELCDTATIPEVCFDETPPSC